MRIERLFAHAEIGSQIVHCDRPEAEIEEAFLSGIDESDERGRGLSGITSHKETLSVSTVSSNPAVYTAK